MQRMFLYTLGLCLLLSASTAGMILIGRSKPIPDRLAMLHLTDCRIPCLIGITPGKTTSSQVKAHIDAVYAASPDYLIEANTPDSNVILLQFLIRTKSNHDGAAIIGVSAAPDGVIDGISIRFFDARGKPLGTPPTVAELHSILGPPASVVIEMTADQTNFLYGTPTEGMQVNPQKFGQWNAQIYSLYFFSTSQPIETDRICPWDGFSKQRTLFGENSVIEFGC